jgi:hypothetical protein
MTKRMGREMIQALPQSSVITMPTSGQLVCGEKSVEEHEVAFAAEIE